MVRRSAILLLLLCVLDPRASAAVDQSVIDAFSLGGRFEYDLSANSESSPFPWNWSGQSLRDRTRLMLELRAPGTKYGELYLKGVGNLGVGHTFDIPEHQNRTLIFIQLIQ